MIRMKEIIVFCNSSFDTVPSESNINEQFPNVPALTLHSSFELISDEYLTTADSYKQSYINNLYSFPIYTALSILKDCSK